MVGREGRGNRGGERFPRVQCWPRELPTARKRRDVHGNGESSHGCNAGCMYRGWPRSTTNGRDEPAGDGGKGGEGKQGRGKVPTSAVSVGGIADGQEARGTGGACKRMDGGQGSRGKLAEGGFPRVQRRDIWLRTTPPTTPSKEAHRCAASISWAAPSRTFCR